MFFSFHLFCFRFICNECVYIAEIVIHLFAVFMQAENEAERIDWMNKIMGVIASLLNSHLQQVELSEALYINDKSAGGHIIFLALVDKS